MFFHEICFGSKILSSCCDRHQNFDYGCSSYPGKEAQSPDFGTLGPWVFPTGHSLSVCHLLKEPCQDAKEICSKCYLNYFRRFLIEIF